MSPFRSLTSTPTSCVSLECDRLVAASRRAAIDAIAAMALATATGCGGARSLPATAVEAPTVSPAASPVSETMQPWSEGMSDTAPNRFLETKGIRFAYRAFGRKPGVPIVLLAPLGRTMDFWDSKLMDALARDHLVVLFDSAGVGLSTGETPKTAAEMAQFAEVFIDGLKELHLTDSDWVNGRIDLLGFGLGGFVAQQFAIDRPDLVERIVLAGTAPQGGEGFATSPADLAKRETASPPPADDLLYLLFAPSETSKAAGRAFIARLGARQRERDTPIASKAVIAQTAAVKAWSAAPKAGRYSYLSSIKQPVLVADGEADVVMPTNNSRDLAQNLPGARLVVYRDSGHAFLFQYPDAFAKDVSAFLQRQ